MAYLPPFPNSYNSVLFRIQAYVTPRLSQARITSLSIPSGSKWFFGRGGEGRGIFVSKKGYGGRDLISVLCIKIDVPESLDNFCILRNCSTSGLWP